MYLKVLYRETDSYILNIRHDYLVNESTLIFNEMRIDNNYWDACVTFYSKVIA